jgi:hypothetical protein
MTDPVVLLLTGAEAEGSTIPEAVPIESLAPETQGAAEGAPEPMEVAVEEAAATAGVERDDVLSKPAMEVVVRSPEIQPYSPSSDACSRTQDFRCENFSKNLKLFVWN